MALLFTGCVTSDKLLVLSEPQFPMHKIRVRILLTS